MTSNANSFFDVMATYVIYQSEDVSTLKVLYFENLNEGANTMEIVSEGSDIRNLY